jgi:threonine/homoserine/homoserine lactone efflux protein
MSWQTWWLFFATVFALSGTPGPNMLHIMSRSVAIGAWRTVPAMAGCLAALLVMLTASAAGLGALLLASPKLFEMLRYFGAAYLVWLGIKAWRQDDSAREVDRANVAQSTLNRYQIFRAGFFVGISNPKLLLFAAAFLPQFIDQSSAQWSQFAVLVATFTLCELFWYVVYALGGAQLRRYLSRPSLRRAFDRFTGTLFIGFGVLLLRFRPE